MNNKTIQTSILNFLPILIYPNSSFDVYLPLQKSSFDKDAISTPFRKKSKSLVKIFSITAKNNDNHLSWSYLSPNSSITSITVRNNFLAREKAQIAANSAALQLANYFPETDWMEYFRNFPLVITRRASKLFIINSKRTRISRVLENVTRSEFILLPAFSYNRSFYESRTSLCPHFAIQSNVFNPRDGHIFVQLPICE